MDSDTILSRRSSKGLQEDDAPTLAELEHLSRSHNSIYTQQADMARYRSGEAAGIIGGEFPLHGALDLDPTMSEQERHEKDVGIGDDSDSSSDDEDVEGGGVDREAEDEKPVQVLPDSRRFTLRFTQVKVWVPATFKTPSLLDRIKSMHNKNKGIKGGKTKRQVLFGICGKVLPGEVLALMGPSGCGKSTLLSVIGGRVASMVEYEGHITVNGHPMNKSVRRQIGFVLQDDVLYESLTVWETLLYAALLRLPHADSKQSKLDRVDGVLSTLGLSKARNTIIGGPMRRGVSGGERKRVSIGHELLIDPSVLMLDEPTSGLDSTTAMHLLFQLRRLANEGRAILTTIHQPSSRLYQKLDKLMLLSEGHVMYYGDAHLVNDWFDHYGFKISAGVNTADFIMDVGMGEVRSGKLVGRRAVTSLYQMFEEWYAHNPKGYHSGLAAGDLPKLVAVKDVALPGSPQQVKGGAAGGAEKDDDKQVVVDQAACEKDAEGDTKELPITVRDGATWPEQFMVLLMRSVKVRRFEALSITSIVQFVAVAVLTGLLWWQRGQSDTLAGVNDVVGLLFFQMMFPSMRSLFAALFTFPNEFRMLMKERPSGMYKLSAYYLARMSSDLPIEILLPFIFCTIIYWFGGLRRTAEAFICNTLTILMLTFVSQSWGLLIGGVFMDPKVAQTISTIVQLMFLLVSGFYVRDIPAWIGWVRVVSLFYWGFNLLLKIQLKDRTFTDCGGFGGPVKPCEPVTDIKEALQLPVDPNKAPTWDIVALVLMLILLRVATYLVLRAKTRGRKI